MNKRWILPPLFLCLFAACPAQGRFRLVEWNVENLFDTCHDAGKDDAEFLPQSNRHWTAQRYRHKLSQIARTLAAVGEGAPPDLVALCEVENDSVLAQLTRRSLLARLGYEYLVTNSPDRRGIDVALLYQPGSFCPLSRCSLRILPPEGMRPTRDILHVAGRLQQSDTLDVYVCHFPSRAGGTSKSEAYRGRVAQVLRQSVDSVFRQRVHAHIIITGDFNDEATNACVAQQLGAATDRTRPLDRRLYALTYLLRAPQDVCGTYRHGGEWNQLDQIIVSGDMLGSLSSLHFLEGSCRIAAFPWLLTERHGAVQPLRTYSGLKYLGGISDHLPLSADFGWDYSAENKNSGDIR